MKTLLSRLYRKLKVALTYQTNTKLDKLLMLSGKNLSLQNAHLATKLIGGGRTKSI